VCAKGPAIVGAMSLPESGWTAGKRKSRTAMDTKKAAETAFLFLRGLDYAENDDPQPQVEVAFGFLITNCAPSIPS
jgi:hypothetical protein